jgi:hypothetical protein
MATCLPTVGVGRGVGVDFGVAEQPNRKIMIGRKKKSCSFFILNPFH